MVAPMGFSGLGSVNVVRLQQLTGRDVTPPPDRPGRTSPHTGSSLLDGQRGLWYSISSRSVTMNRRKFFQTIGLGAMTAAVATVLPKFLIPKVPPTTYSTYVIGAAALPAIDFGEDTVFRAIAERRAFPMHTEVKRRFFQYE